jgi:hypothetical protein
MFKSPGSSAAATSVAASHSTAATWGPWPEPGFVPWSAPTVVASGAMSVKGRQGWSRLAIVSVLLALPGLYLGVFFVPQVVAITLGAIAHQRIAATGQRGRRLAIAGIIIGCLEILLWIILVIAVLVAPVGPGPGSAIMG